MACRETLDIWFKIKKLILGYNSRYRGRTKTLKWIIKTVFWKAWFDKITRHYFWHDSFGKYFNRYIKCLLVNHGNIQYLPDGGCGGSKPRYYCFDCEKNVSWEKTI